MTTRPASEAVVALLLALALVGAAAAFGSGRSGQPDLRTSTFLDERSGARALHLLLETLELDPQRSVDPPDEGTPTDRTLVLLAPSWAVGRLEARALLDWTARGGRLVVADAPSLPPDLTVDVSPLLRPLGLVTVPSSGRADVKLAAGAPTRAKSVTWPARLVLTTIAGARPDPRAGAVEELASTAEGLVAVRARFGAGEIVALSDVSLFTNTTLRSEDDAIFAVDLLAGDGARRIVFDEYHHGYTPTGGRGGIVSRVGSLLVETWVGRALLVLALAGVVLVAGAAVRLGAPLPRPVPPRRAMREHADALGRLLESARASREALEVLVGGVRRTAASRAGLPATASSATLRARLARSAAPGARELAAALEDAEATALAPRTKDVEFARVAANLAAAKRRFLHGSG